MVDPLSISASIIALLQAVKNLCDFIDRINGAPEGLLQAGLDLKETDSILQGLSQYLEASKQTPSTIQALTDQRSALNLTLLRCKQQCNEFRKKLEKCVSHSDEVGKLSWTDRLMTGMRKGSIEKFQAEISRTRQLIGLRVEMISLLKSEQNTTAINEFQQKNEAAMSGIMQQLADLDITIAELQELADESSEAMEKTLKDQEVVLKEQLRLCEENRAAAESQARSKQEFGDTKAGDNARNFQGLDLDEVEGSFEQKYGNTEIGNGAWSFQGASGGDMMATFFHGRADAAQAESVRGPGRRLGGNIGSFQDLRSGPAPGSR